MFTLIMRRPPQNSGWSQSCWPLTLGFQHVSWAVSKILSIGIENDCFEHGMNTSEYRAGERIVTVRLTEVTLVVDLADGAVLVCRLLGIRAYFMRRPHNEVTGNWQGQGLAFIGPRSMKTYPSVASSPVYLLSALPFQLNTRANSR
jgi:hypothetical protein